MTQASPQGINEDAANYLPGVLSQRQAAHVGAVELRYVEESDKRYLYTYCVDWQEDIKNIKNNLQATDYTEMLGLDFIEKTPITATKSISVKREEQSKIKTTTPAETSTFESNLLETCDGPCRAKYSVNDLTVMGLCEHIICKNCLTYAPRTKTSTSGYGCPNSKCHMLDVEVLCPDKKTRLKKIKRFSLMKSPAGPKQVQSPTKFSSMSQNANFSIKSPSVSTAFEAGSIRCHRVKVAFIVVKEVNGKPFQSRVTYSYPSTTTLGEVWTKAITEDFPGLKFKHISGRRYLCNDNHQISDRHLWTPITEKMEQKQLSVYENYGYGLNIVVNLVNYSC